jgi:hypothetical protein
LRIELKDLTPRQNFEPQISSLLGLPYLVFALAAAVVMPLPPAADLFLFSTGNPDGRMAAIRITPS